MALPKAKKQKKARMSAGAAKTFFLNNFGGEPTFSPLAELTNMELIKVYTWYSNVMSRKDGMQFLYDYLAKRDKPLLKKLRAIGETKVSISYCWLARLIDRGAPLSAETVAKLPAHLEEVIGRWYGKEEETEKKTTSDEPPRVDRSVEKERFFIGDVEEILDLDGSKSVYDYLTANEVPKGYAPKIAAYYAPVLAELREALEGKDRDLKEGYRHLSKGKLRDLVNRYQRVVDDCERYAENKTVKRVVKKKAVPIEKLVGNVKYMARFDEYQLVSKHPSVIIGAKEFWVYDARYRDIIRYVAGEDGFTVRGTSVYGYDETLSVKKSTGRKSREVVDALIREGKVGLKKFMDNVKAPPREPNGRINANMLIVKAIT
jgi:hypothetical protein